MKKQIYLVSFMLLGVLVGFLLHALIEVWYIRLLVRNFDKFSLGFTWSAWQQFHDYGVIFLTLGFGGLGLFCGIHFWRILYVDRTMQKKWGLKLKKEF